MRKKPVSVPARVTRQPRRPPRRRARADGRTSRRTAAIRPGAARFTKQQFVYATLRRAIIRCEIAPGSRLVIDDLARRLRVSIIPVREALRLLQSEGLVHSVAHVGATVAPVSLGSVVEVFTVMEGLEVVATRMAAQRAGPAGIARLVDLVTQMDRALIAGAPQRWAELNTRFHLTISGLAAMPLLQEMMQRAFDHWDRVRRVYFADVLVHRAEIAQAQHHWILEHLRARDLPRLEQAIRQHNQGALAAYTSHLAATKGDEHASR